MLHELGYRLQTNRKTLEGRQHPDRDAQFEHINERCQAFQEQGQPVISVDTKKKELIGQYRNGGREWRPQGRPEEVKVYDFPDKELGKGFLMGCTTWWPTRAGSVSGWTTTRQRLRWRRFGVGGGWRVYGGAQRLLITADGGGSNANRNRLWKLELQRLADELGLDIGVPFSARNEQVEQDRAPDVLSHYRELAWTPVGKP